MERGDALWEFATDCRIRSVGVTMAASVGAHTLVNEHSLTSLTGPFVSAPGPSGWLTLIVASVSSSASAGSGVSL